LDLYNGLSEPGANPIVNNTSSVKFIDLETWYYKTQYDNQSQECDTPVLCTFVGNFQQYPQMLIITVSNQLQGITLQGIGGQGFSNVCYKQNLIRAPVLWGQNMLSQQCMIGQSKSVVFTLFDNYGRKVPTQYMDMYNNLLLEIQTQ
ncbi:MAG: hypothetical protein EZS28_056038, partial [Streblomastix strix]